MNMENTKVQRYHGYFLVTYYWRSIKISRNLVDLITQDAPDLEQEDIGILLATITEEGVIPEWSEWEKEDYTEMKYKVIINGLTNLLQHYDIDTLNSIFEEMKCYEIENVLESDNPISVLSDYI